MAAYRLGRHPTQPGLKYEAEKAFEGAIRTANRGLMLAGDEIYAREFHGRLRIVRDAVSRPESDPTNPDHVVWLAAVRYFAQELSVPDPSSSHELELSPDASRLKDLTPSRSS